MAILIMQFLIFSYILRNPQGRGILNHEMKCSNVWHTFGWDSCPLARLQKDLTVGGSFASQEHIINEEEALLLTRK